MDRTPINNFRVVPPVVRGVDRISLVVVDSITVSNHYLHVVVSMNMMQISMSDTTDREVADGAYLTDEMDGGKMTTAG